MRMGTFRAIFIQIDFNEQTFGYKKYNNIKKKRAKLNGYAKLNRKEMPNSIRSAVEFPVTFNLGCA